MTYYELFQQGPAVYIPLLVLNLVITLLGYGLFPIVFAKIRKKPTTKKKYNFICYGVNFLVAILFTVLDEKFSVGPYLLWTFIFSSKGIKILKKRYLLDNFKPVEDLFGDKDENDSDKPADTSAEELPEKDIQTANHAQIVNIVEPTNNNKNTKQKKVRYCSHCGSLIDNETKICSGCGKKYFKGIRFTKTSVIIVVLSVLLLASLIVIGILLSKEYLNKDEVPSVSQKPDYYVNEDGEIYSYADWAIEEKNSGTISKQDEFTRAFFEALDKRKEDNSFEQKIFTEHYFFSDNKQEEHNGLSSFDYSYTSNDYEYETTCLSVGCDNLPNNSSFYCSEHACAKRNCSSERTYSSSFCRRHKCDSISCDNGANEDGYYCSEHACAENGCFREKEYSGNYCSYHECDEVLCKNRKKGYSSYCSEHECADRYCSSSKSPMSDYCFIHDD